MDVVEKWDKRFLDVAKLVASWSKDPSTQTGAVLVRQDRTIASLGYNGFASRMRDTPALYENREEKYSRIVHCEMNALLQCSEKPKGYTLYTYPFLSCDRCAVHMISAGVVRVVAPKLPAHLHERWLAPVEKSKSYFQEAGVEVCEY